MTTAAISQLRATLPEDRIITPDAPSYKTAVTTPWSQTCWTPAASYIYPSNAQELASVLSILKETGCKFAIQTTGHNPNEGFSSADQTGVVLNLRELKSMEIVHDSGSESGSGLDGAVARVGAGRTWGEVYTWLEERKLSAIGGRDQQVGLGGFLTGGIIYPLHKTRLADTVRWHGCPSQSVWTWGRWSQEFRGGCPSAVKQIITCIDLARRWQTCQRKRKREPRSLSRSQRRRFQLWYLIHLPGRNTLTISGIVTRFDLETHPLINVQYTISLYNPDDYIEINKATVAVQEAMETDPKLGLFTNFNQGFVAVGLLYGDTPTERPAAFKPFDDLGVISTVLPTTNGTLLSLAQAMGHAQEPKK